MPMGLRPLPMSATFAARLLLTAVAAGQGLAPLFIDLNRTHATHPLWPGHARFHLVWQTCTLTLASAVEVVLVWWAGPLPSQRFYLAALLSSLPLAGFLAALMTRRFYRGTLHDEGGIPPARIRIGRRALELDMNTAVVAFAGMLLLLAASLF